MTPNEIRIGNLIKDWSDSVGRVTCIDGEDVQTTANNLMLPIDQYEGIPLSPEWLEKCGFEYIEEGVYLWADSKHCFYEHKDGGILFSPFCTNDKDLQLHILHLHQLQNVIFALTATDLPITL